MNAVFQIDKVQNYCKSKISESGIYKNEFFKSLEDGTMSLEEFIETQKQFYYAVSFFSRPMTALMARIPNPGSRLSILENVVEEHGGFNETAFHESTFREFLNSLGVDVK
ncbi:MAG: iron-containing redox enzyme family protein, partial [Lentisphaeraceae bacterium]|nr:iron-containing redox enzyme family protein [Lentisphaeraceae bacterium]